MISRTKYTKKVLVGSPAVLVRDEIHCSEYPGTCWVMNVGYPGSKISTRFNPIGKMALSPEFESQSDSKLEAQFSGLYSGALFHDF